MIYAPIPPHLVHKVKGATYSRLNHRPPPAPPTPTAFAVMKDLAERYASQQMTRMLVAEYLERYHPGVWLAPLSEQEERGSSAAALQRAWNNYIEISSFSSGTAEAWPHALPWRRTT